MCDDLNGSAEETWISGLLDALAFLTVVNFPFRSQRALPGQRSVACFSVVGAVLGLVAGFIAWLGGYSFGPLGAGLGGVAALAVLSGGIHLDGLADSFDGLFSHAKSAEERISTMKDPTVGAFGVAGLCFVEASKVGAVAGLAQASQNASKGLLAAAVATTCALGVAASVARGWAASVLGLGQPAQAGGLGAGIGSNTKVIFGGIAALSGAAISAGALALWRPLDGLGVSILVGLLAWAIGGSLTWSWYWFCKRRATGFTGDTLGAGIELAELGALALFVAALVPRAGW